ncbi:hypothetical protein EPO33_04350 [Patescibacteria group bacterium]|nr:MAG: hypothetical protein EPO33_04350 [Patescibacteria group bacterium]
MTVKKDSRFKGTRGVRTGDIAEAAIVERIKAFMAQGKTREQALDAVSQERKVSLQTIKQIADQHGL